MHQQNKSCWSNFVWFNPFMNPIMNSTHKISGVTRVNNLYPIKHVENHGEIAEEETH
uniref:Uncharacterized protein n=1 Tax=Arundo donax TaxID=35708 RepID=A0A0A8XTX0_ARUDO